MRVPCLARSVLAALRRLGLHRGPPRPSTPHRRPRRRHLHAPGRVPARAHRHATRADAAPSTIATRAGPAAHASPLPRRRALDACSDEVGARPARRHARGASSPPPTTSTGDYWRATRRAAAAPARNHVSFAHGRRARSTASTSTRRRSATRPRRSPAMRAPRPAPREEGRRLRRRLRRRASGDERPRPGSDVAPRVPRALADPFARDVAALAARPIFGPRERQRARGAPDRLDGRPEGPRRSPSRARARDGTRGPRQGRGDEAATEARRAHPARAGGRRACRCLAFGADPPTRDPLPRHPRDARRRSSAPTPASPATPRRGSSTRTTSTAAASRCGPRPHVPRADADV